MEIESNKVEINQGEVPDLTFAKNFNDLDQAWIKARKELLLAFPKESSFREIGYDLIIEFMNPTSEGAFEDACILGFGRGVINMNLINGVIFVVIILLIFSFGLSFTLEFLF